MGEDYRFYFGVANCATNSIYQFATFRTVLCIFAEYLISQASFSGLRMKRGFNVLYGAFSVHCIRQKSIDTPLISGKALFDTLFRRLNILIMIFPQQLHSVISFFFMLYLFFSLFRCRISENLKLQAKTKKRELT